MLKQSNQIGKRPNKVDILNAKFGKTFQTPRGKQWVFEYRKEGNKYIFIICYNEKRMQIKESDFNLTPIDRLLILME